MVSARRKVLLVAGALCSFAAVLGPAGCADTDPRYGPPEAIRGREIDFGDSGAAPDPVIEGGPPVTPARAAFNTLYASMAPTCNGCHAPGGIGSIKFAPPSKDESYMIFQMQNYKKLDRAPAGFYNKGPHSSGAPELTAAQKMLTEAWSAAETAGGGMTMPADSGAPPADAGDGG